MNIGLHNDVYNIWYIEGTTPAWKRSRVLQGMGGAGGHGKYY